MFAMLIDIYFIADLPFAKIVPSWHGNTGKAFRTRGPTSAENYMAHRKNYPYLSLNYPYDRKSYPYLSFSLP